MADTSKETINTGDQNRKVSSKSAENKRDVFSYHINRLRKRTQDLRILGFLIFYSTLIGLVLSILPRTIFSYLSIEVFDIARLISTIVAIMAMCLIVAYEYRCRVGRALFEEISDEFQWRKHGEFRDVPPDEESDESAPLDARIALREFTRTIDLPLIPGRFGPAVYMLVNISSIAATTFILAI